MSSFCCSVAVAVEQQELDRGRGRAVDAAGVEGGAFRGDCWGDGLPSLSLRWVAASASGSGSGADGACWGDLPRSDAGSRRSSSSLLPRRRLLRRMASGGRVRSGCAVVSGDSSSSLEVVRHVRVFARS